LLVGDVDGGGSGQSEDAIDLWPAAHDHQRLIRLARLLA
jgi:hypothetical protein